MVAARRDAGRHDEPHRRRRQPRGHADRLHRVWLQRPEPRARRGHQYDRRHVGRRFLRGLRVVRRSLPRHDRPGRGNADARRAEPDARQVGRQQVPGRVLPGLRNQRLDCGQHLGQPAIEVRIQRDDQPERHPRAQQRDVEVSRHQHQRWRPDQEGPHVVVLLVPQSENVSRPAELHRTNRWHVLRHEAVESVG